MQFNVSQLLREPVGSRRQYLIDEQAVAVGEEGGAQFVRMEGRTDLLRTQRGVLVQAALQSTGLGNCDRCLGQITYPVEITFEEEFLPSVDPTTGAVLPVSEEPGLFRIDQRHILDIAEAARQAWILALPMRFLCKADCAGLCPECGFDRNMGACSCSEASIDPRWATLSTLVGPRADNRRQGS